MEIWFGWTNTVEDRSGGLAGFRIWSISSRELALNVLVVLIRLLMLLMLVVLIGLIGLLLLVMLVWLVGLVWLVWLVGLVGLIGLVMLDAVVIGCLTRVAIVQALVDQDAAENLATVIVA